MLYRVHLAWAGFELSTLVVIGTDCIGSCKSNYQTITTMTVPSLIGSRYIISNIQKEVPQSDDIDDILNINFLKIGKEWIQNPKL